MICLRDRVLTDSAEPHPTRLGSHAGLLHGDDDFRLVKLGGSLSNRQFAIEHIELETFSVDHQRDKFSLEDANFFGAIHPR